MGSLGISHNGGILWTPCMHGGYRWILAVTIKDDCLAENIREHPRSERKVFQERGLGD